jgi:hypothetical protein
MSTFTDLQLADIAALAAGHAVPEDRRRALISVAIRARTRAEPLRFTWAGDGGFEIASGKWQCDGAGAVALCLAAHNPGRWLGLREGKSRKAWWMAVRRAVDGLRRIDPELAQAMAPTAERNAPGVHLRTRGGQVELMLRLPPGCHIRVGVTLA